MELPQIRPTPQSQSVYQHSSHSPQSSPPPSSASRQREKKKPLHKSDDSNAPLSPSRFKSTAGDTMSTSAGNATMMKVNGIVFDPQTLSTHAGVASILMQQPGKEKVKEVKARRKSTVFGGTAEISSGDGEPAGEASKRGRQVKELMFGQLVKANMEYERSKELKWFVCTGRIPFTEEERSGKQI